MNLKTIALSSFAAVVVAIGFLLIVHLKNQEINRLRSQVVEISLMGLELSSQCEETVASNLRLQIEVWQLRKVLEGKEGSAELSNKKYEL